MLWLDQKYIGFLSPYLEGFKKIDNTTFNFRCPICGDSEYKRKKRGYFYFKKGKYSFFCHNCSASMGLSYFLKERHPDLYGQYLVEKMKEQNEQNKDPALKEFEFKFKKPDYVKNSGLINLPKISSLKHDHPAKEYIVGRQIPNPYHAKLFYTETFKAWVNSQKPEKFKDIQKDEARIIIPLINLDKQLVGFQGRSLIPDDKVRYITIMLDEEDNRIFNLDMVDIKKPIYVFEGPIDAMFIPNSIATCGGQLTSELQRTDDKIPKERFVVCYDNQPRNKDIVRNIGRAIKGGYKVFIGTDEFKKDLNDMILEGHSIDYIKSLIDSRTFSGLRAELEFNEWKK